MYVFILCIYTHILQHVNRGQRTTFKDSVLALNLVEAGPLLFILLKNCWDYICLLHLVFYVVQGIQLSSPSLYG